MDDLVNFRLDAAEKRAVRTDVRFDRIDVALMDIKVQLARTARAASFGAPSRRLQVFPHPH
jgi:hypothetical protein